MGDARSSNAKRIRLTGERFRGGRLPIDSLIELQRYQDAIRRLAEHEWYHDHPDEALPADFDESVSLTIERIGDGSADVFLAFEQHAAYVQYQEEARDAVDATIAAAYAGESLPYLPSLPRDAANEVREELARIGETLEANQAIEFFAYGEEAPPVIITTETRPRAQANLILTDFLSPPDELAPPSTLETRQESLVGRVTAVDADSTRFEMLTSTGRVHGWYRDNVALLEDLRAVLNSAEEGPLTRVTGELQFKNGEPTRFWKASLIERFEFDESPTGERLTQFAMLPSGWEDGEGNQISSVALEGAQSVLRQIEHAGLPLPGLFPTSEGGVLLEWADLSSVMSIEVLEDGAFELFRLVADERHGTHSETKNAEDAVWFIMEGYRR
ncbi:hypothetical protein [Agromyces indicus]|uniref:Uncharacterized protein n=1 Tax=Agromyces indicus TaxID=758919 RepID=A0ABU1FJF6_9MICO|nr:hypothetical protein [Agromyces indicus]MDR5691891.1 hypothetical protein [Agromyces indicus]